MPAVDVVKAAGWAVLAAVALSLHVLLAAVVAGPQLYGLLAVLGFGLLLPPLMILHARFTQSNAHGALLATLAGTATAITGVAALLTNDLEPAALFFFGMWWWTTGKLARETASLPRAFATITMWAAPLLFAAMLADILGLGRWAWQAPRLALAIWLVALAASWYRERDMMRMR